MNWQPIETAPRMGVRVLFLAPEDAKCSRVQIGWFNKWDEPCWQGLAHNPVPTHWMPLPPPPTEQHTPASEIAGAVEGEAK